MRMFPFAASALWLVVCHAPARADDPSQAASALTSRDLPSLERRIDTHLAMIRNRDDFDAFMRANPGESNPINLLPGDARRRFIAHLDFEMIRQGFITDPADIEAELTLSQAWRLLSLFGAQESILVMPDIRVESDDDRLVLKWRTAMEAEE